MNKSAPVLIMGGGTGGHVYPGLAVAEQLIEKNIPVQWLGTTEGIEARVVPGFDIPLHFLPVSGIRGKNIVATLKGVINLFIAQWRAIKLVREIKPRSVLGMGGYVSGPGGVAAKILGIPLLIHEQNAVAGTTNKLLSRVANKVLQAFPDVLPTSRTVTVGNPIRKDIVTLGEQKRRIEDVKTINLLVLGGSLGAQAINQVMPLVLKQFAPEQRPNVRHQAGVAHADSIRELYRSHDLEDVVVVPFIDAISEAYEWADVVICRAGALTVSEICTVGLPAIFVPLPQAIDDHQTKNATMLVKENAALMLPQQKMNEETLFQLIEKIIVDRNFLTSLADSARSLAKPFAARDVADACLEVSA